MANLSDFIEGYIKELLEQSGQGLVEIQRINLAEKFKCAPSQINYVISTRFSFVRGYVVESRRGGGGYVRIEKIALNNTRELSQLIGEIIGDSVNQQTAEALITRFAEEGYLTNREAKALKAATNTVVLGQSSPFEERLRARIIKAMLISLFSSK